MKKLGIIIGALISLGSLSSHACTEDGNEGFLPENNLWIAPNSSNSSDFTEEMFDSILEKVSGVYSPIIEETGFTLNVVKDWESGTVNAYAFKSNYSKKMFIEFHGGLVRHPEITEDGFTAVVCHELGHHLGGIPLKRVNHWATSEGQADYFATLKCLRRVWENEDNESAIKSRSVPEKLASSCEEQFGSSSEVALCVRSALAGLSTARLLQALRKKDPDELKFSTPDTSEVDETFTAHPEPQCRLDTFFAGSLCTVDYTDDVSFEDLNAGTCTKENGYTVGNRPRCWLKP